MSQAAAVPTSVQVAKKHSSHIAGLDGIRAIAVLLVMLSHTAPGRLGLFIPAGLGVTIFFFLSGFLITTLLRREWSKTGDVSLRNFYGRRALRILPPLYLCYAVAEIFDRVILHTPVSTKEGFFSLLFYYFNYGYALDAYVHLHTFLPHGLSVAWSLCVEEHFYLIFPLVFLWLGRSSWPRRKQAGVLLGFCVLELAWRATMVLTHMRGADGWSYYATDARLDSILWGAWLALFANPLFQDRPLLPARLLTPAFWFAVVALIASSALRGQLYRDAIRYSLHGVLLLAIFSFVAARQQHWVVRALETPALRYIGWISYTLYLSHYIFLEAFEAWWPQSPVARMAATLLAAFVFSALMRFAVETPLLRWRNRLHREPHTPEAA
ncbi:acyltransferase family protein [Granulicella cerasi]|uniref:Acyltransferase family protein n=1 Tax=Granulicella cerasi TaxID=741063 RepID=A0ABW1ZAU5_9BACT|nr:acyltransferase [Granulicella cerasi]